ncbi:hypothetical protein L5515_011711 [Caenorhabditis briggsae]|uniref:Uncharacterized protein n=1 Tax=Caenorhabditis briggsae TaxID=6238 RepID=A0AAE9EXA2_CAEBR|nr:hypothetical protein L5515_011711 [Caenorhabditis briggsae]
MSQLVKQISVFTTAEQYQKIIHQLLGQLSRTRETVADEAAVENNILIIRNHIEQLLEKRFVVLASPELGDDEFEDEWNVLVWGLLVCIVRLPQTIEKDSTTESLNLYLIRLINMARPLRLPKVSVEREQWWNQFFDQFNNLLHFLHGLLSQLQNPNCNVEIKMRAFFTRQLRPCLAAFRRGCVENSPLLHTELRRVQVENLSNHGKLLEDDLREIKKYYSSLTYILGILAIRIQGLRFECQSSSTNMYATPDTLWQLLQEVMMTYEQVMNDALMCNEPSGSPIMVTNNLFTFTCYSLNKTLFYNSFDIQIVSEETAAAIQNEIIQCRMGSSSPKEPKLFPSAALIAMKPTTGVKRNNATANQKGTGGNTAHKKSDVNSQEFVTIPALFSEPDRAFQTTYPHLLCTTRQKDAVLLDTKSGATGKRPLFYFYIRAKTWSPSGDDFYVRTLSLPFTISTRRNQDCQVQRMNSSYTATCFWMYGTCSFNGLLLNWNENPLTWTQFKELTRRYFMVNGEVKRTMEESDYALLEDKMHCEQCGDDTDDQHGENCISFKNILCSHLRFDTDTVQMRFSVWRGILEVLQIFQDPKAAVKTLWENYLMHGFLDTQAVMNLLIPRHNCMVIRLTYILGGSVCVSYRTLRGEIVHLEPLELKKLQAKSILEYISDIAETAKIDYLLTYNLDYMPVSSVIEKYFKVDDVKRVRGVSSNITDKGPLNHVTHVKFTPLRVAVVACREHTPRPSPRPSESHDIPSSSSSESHYLFNVPSLPQRYEHHHNQNHDPMTSLSHMMPSSSSTTSPINTTPTMMPPLPMNQSFEMQLEALMKQYGKTPQEVVETVSFAARTSHHHLEMLPPHNSNLRSASSLVPDHNASFEEFMDDLTNSSNDDYIPSLDFSHTNHSLRV